MNSTDRKIQISVDSKVKSSGSVYIRARKTNGKGTGFFSKYWET